MYYICGHNDSLMSIARAINYKYNERFLCDDMAKMSYSEFLYKNSVFNVPVLSDKIKIITNEGLEVIAPKFYREQNCHYSKSSGILKERINSGYFKSALNSFLANDPALSQLACFIIKVILIVQLKTYTNGTTKKTIGLCTIDFKDCFSREDFIELIYHQLIHMLLFIDHYTKQHIILNNEKAMIETSLKYRLGGNSFPAYLAFHSYIVGVEVLAFRRAYLGWSYAGNYHGTTARIFILCNEFKLALMRSREIFSQHGQCLLSKTYDLLNRMSEEYSTYLKEHKM